MKASKLCAQSLDITSSSSTLRTLLPELYALKTITERNDWHTDDPFRQSLRLRQWVAELPASVSDLGLTIDDHSPRSKAKRDLRLIHLLTGRVDVKEDGYTMQELLKFIALIHDVGKKETFEINADGTTRCPGHEALGAHLALAICARFNFTSLETDFIITLVRNHGEPYALFKEIAGLSTAEQENRIRCFGQKHADHLLPLLLLACGDLVTSHLRVNRRERYEAILNFYFQWIFGSLLPTVSLSDE